MLETSELNLDSTDSHMYLMIQIDPKRRLMGYQGFSICFSRINVVDSVLVLEINTQPFSIQW